MKLHAVSFRATPGPDGTIVATLLSITNCLEEKVRPIQSTGGAFNQSGVSGAFGFLKSSDDNSSMYLQSLSSHHLHQSNRNGGARRASGSRVRAEVPPSAGIHDAPVFLSLIHI